MGFIIPANAADANNVNRTQLIHSLADQCVKCGLCLPHCPTYRVCNNEADSPRGRIAMCQAIIADNNAPDPSLLVHLDRCLLCRQCERVCPSQVAYQRIYSATFTLLTERGQSVKLSWLAKLTQHPVWISILRWPLWLYQRSGLATMLRWLGMWQVIGWAEQEKLLPTFSIKDLPTHVAAQGTQRGRIAIFTGCLGRHLEQEAILATAHIAAHCGYTVDLLPQQSCCGALHHHQGDDSHTLAMARANIGAFAQENYDAIVYLTTGCAAHLLDYANLPWNNSADKAAATAFVAKLQEACQWVSQHASLPINNSQPMTVLWHQPCSHRNVIGHTDVVKQLLLSVPGLQLSPLPSSLGCCGGAGDYPIREPDLAAAVREPVVSAILAQTTDYLVTTNLGCALSLTAGVREQRPSLRVAHPVTLVAKAMGI